MKKNLAIISLFTLFSINSFSQTPSYLPTDSLLGWWPFNGNAIDESNNNNDGYEVDVTLSSDRFGDENKCFHFDNIGEYILVPNNENLDLNSSFSISLWFYCESTTMFNSFISKASCNDPSLKGYVCGLQDFYTGGGNSKIHFQAYPYMYDANPTLPEDDDMITPNLWYHFVVTYDKPNNNLKYYLNNELIESLELEFDIIHTELDLIFGNHFDVFQENCINSFMIGKLDDIGMWNRVITDKEIGDLYNSTDINSGVQSNNSYNTISVFPNPTTDVVNIDFHDLNKFEGGKVKIMSMSGQIVYEENITQSKMTLSVVDRFSKGIYIVTTTDSGGNILSNEKLIVQ